MTDRKKRKPFASVSGNAGSALLLVMCLMAGVTVLCLGILLGAYSLNRRIRYREERETARVLAGSVSRRLTENLTDSVYRSRPHEPEKSIFDYVGYWILDPEGRWPDYDGEKHAGHDLESARRTFRLTAEGEEMGEAGETQVSLYWTKEDADSFSDMRICLVLEVTCYYGDGMYQAKTVLEKTMEEEEREEIPARISEASPAEAEEEEEGPATMSESRRENPVGNWREEGSRAVWRWTEASGEDSEME